MFDFFEELVVWEEGGVVVGSDGGSNGVPALVDSVVHVSINLG